MTDLPPDESNDKPTYASTRDEILQAVRENSIRRGLFFLKNLSALRVDSILAEVDQYAATFDMEVWRDAAPQIGIDLSALATLDQHEPPVPYPYYFCLPQMLIENPLVIREGCIKGRKIVKVDYSWDKVSDSYEKLFGKMIND